jgi:uncharacterized protein with ParB-like and HNH nuclease domain
MHKKISGAEYPLKDIFSSKFAYSIPPYQRPYAWTEEEAGTLLDDLFDFYRTEMEDDYFLGSIVLIKQDDAPDAQVIDGQQRLTTLTILFAVIASLLAERDRRDYEEFIREQGNKAKGLLASPRLTLRKKDQPFFEKYIQSINIDDMMKIDTTNLKDEAQYHILKNCHLLKDRISAELLDNDSLTKFGEFLVRRCFLVAVCTPSQQSAYRVFSVMNSRGLDLLPTDIIKSDVLGKIPQNKQDAYTTKWEDLEQQTGRNGFNDLFGHIRMIYAKTKAKRSLLEEFKECVLTSVAPVKFIDDILTPYADAFYDLHGKCYAAIKNAQDINGLLSWLNKINNADWLPPAILFLAEKRDDADYVLWFFKRLERLAAFMHLTSKDINFRIERYAKIIKEIQDNPTSSLITPLTSIELTDGEIRSFLTILQGDIYGLVAIRRNYMILRLDSFVSDSAATYDSSVLTIEHILPQTIDPLSEWDSWWPDEDKRLLWLNKIANLVPLTRRTNSAAQNYDFDRKKKEYFQSKRGTTSYSLTTQVLATPTWTEAVVTQRQTDLIQVFKGNWML